LARRVRGFYQRYSSTCSFKRSIWFNYI